jgi:hypothetical protein
MRPAGVTLSFSSSFGRPDCERLFMPQQVWQAALKLASRTGFRQLTGQQAKRLAKSLRKAVMQLDQLPGSPRLKRFVADPEHSAKLAALLSFLDQGHAVHITPRHLSA